MAKAGYCSECGRNVYVTPEGACELGHGPECVSGVYETPGPEEAAERTVAPAPGSAQPVYPAAPAPSLPPQRNRTGLVVVVVAMILLLGAFVLAGPLLFRAVTKTTGVKQTSASPARAKVEATIGFMEALLANDTMAIKPYLTDAAQKSITASDWATIASGATTAPATFSKPVWSGDTTAVVTFASADTTGTITFAVDGSKADAVVMDGVSSAGTEHDVIGLVKAGTDWRVLTLDNGAGDVTTFDATFVKSMVP